MADLTTYGMAPVGWGAGQPTGVGAPGGPPPAPVVPESPPYVPGPEEDPEAWGQVILTRGTATDADQAGWVWPPAPGFGLAEIITGTSEQKLDVQKASGKDKAKTKQAGLEPWKATLRITFLTKVWSAVQGMLLDLNPYGPSKGKPWNIAHPEATFAQVKTIQIHKASNIKWRGSGKKIGTVEYEIGEWTPPAKAAAGKGTTTPTSAGSEWYAHNFHAVDNSGKQVPFDTPQESAGFGAGSSSAPSGSYP